MFLRQALINVIHNAIKYSPQSAGTSIAIERGGAKSITISAKDEGPGIADEQVARIFDRFYRIDPGRSREAGDFGLGLAITQRAVYAHGGTITVTAARGGGSRFLIQLP
jgi:two-component system, OmpR family, sensor histidine kinase SenX3